VARGVAIEIGRGRLGEVDGDGFSEVISVDGGRFKVGLTVIKTQIRYVAMMHSWKTTRGAERERRGSLSRLDFLFLFIHFLQFKLG